MMSERISTRNAVCLGFVLLGLSSDAARAQVPPTIVKSFAVASITLNGITSLTFTIQNPNGGSSLTGVAFSDNLPTGPGGGLIVATPNGLTGSCGSGTITAPAGSGFVSLSGGTLAPSASCTFSVTVTGNTVGVMNNTTSNVTSVEGGVGGTASASLSVLGPPVITSPPSATFTVGTAGSFTVTTTGLPIPAISVTGSLPSGVTFVDNGNGTGTLSGSPAPGSAPSYPLTFTASNLISPNATQLFGLFVVAPPVIIKAFGAASIPVNGSTSLTFTIQNNNTTTTLTGIGFSDTLPAGLVVSTPNGLTGSCGGGTITATQATSVISLTGSTLAAATSCTFAVNVTGTAGGTKNNTTGNVTSTEGGTGGTASASISVVAPPTIAKAFGAAAIPVNGSTSLTFTLTNSPANAVGEAGVAFTDTLPAGLVVAASPGLTSTCGGTATAVAGSGSVSLTGGTIAASGTCSVVVNVTGTTSGTKNNTTGAVTSTNGGTGNTASASIAFATPPTITKAFGAASISLNGSTSLTVTVTNPAANTIALTGLAFTDNLPSGLVVATPNNLNNTCGGTATAVAGASSVSLSGGTAATNTSCTVSLNMTGTTAGVKNNTTGAISSTETGPGATSNTATITVVGPPTIAKAFGTSSIALGSSTSLDLTVTNPSATVAVSGIAFTDNLPAGLTAPNGTTAPCGGSLAITGGNLLTFTGGTLAPSAFCTITVTVTGATAGIKNNTTSAVTASGPIVLTGAASNTATVSVLAPPTIAKAFGAPSISLGATTSLGLTLTNPNATAALSGIAFTDNLPAGLTAPNGTTATCGGSLAIASNVLTFTGGTHAAGGGCVITVTVTGATSGLKNNTTGAISATETGAGIPSNTATVNVAVAGSPTIAKSFAAPSVALGGNVVLSLVLTNPGGSALTGLAFTDALPAGLTAANGTTATCGGSLAITGGNLLTFTGGTLAGGANCTITVAVTGAAAGIQNNTTGPISSVETGLGPVSNTATVAVVGPPTIAKAFGAATIPLNGSTSLSFTIQNNNTSTALTGIGFTDNLPAGLVVSTPNGLTGSCGGGTITAAAGSGSASLSGATLAASSSCTFSINVTGTTAGVKNNTTGNVTSAGGGTGGTASASLNVQGSPAITSPASAAFTIGVAGSFTVTTTGFPVPAITVTGSLPPGVTFVDNGNGTGTLSGTPGSGSAPSYPLTFTASNGVNPNAAQTFTLNVGAAAAQDVPALGSVALAVLAALLALAGASAGRGRLLG